MSPRPRLGSIGTTHRTEGSFCSIHPHLPKCLGGLPVLGAGEHKTEQLLALDAGRAIENSVYAAGVAQAPPVSVVRSVLVDPMGVVAADLGLEPGVLTVEVSLESVDGVRESFPMIRQRRLG